MPLSSYKPTDDCEHDVVPEPLRLKYIPPAIYAEESSYFDLTPKKQNESLEPFSRQPKKKVQGTHIDTANKLVCGSPSGRNIVSGTGMGIAPQIAEIMVPPDESTPVKANYTEKKVLIMRETSLSSRVKGQKPQTPRQTQRDSAIGAQSDACYDFSDLVNQQDDLGSKPQSHHMLQVPYSAKSLQSLGQNSGDVSERASAGKDESFQQQTGFSKTRMKKKVITAAAEVLFVLSSVTCRYWKSLSRKFWFGGKISR